MEIGEQTKLDVKITPSNTTEKVTWTSSNSSVATVDANTGLVTAKNPGKVTITAKNSTSTIKSECTVTVNNPKTASSGINSSFYGALVTNYHGPNDGGAKYRIFYADGTNVYLITDDYIHYTQTPSYTDNGFSHKHFSNRTNREYCLSLETTYIYHLFEDIENALYIADPQLLYLSEWEDYFKGNMADSVQGAPTLEMYVASYNQTHGTNITVSSYNEDSSDIGYYYKYSDIKGAKKGEYEINAIEDFNGIYIKKDTSKAYRMYLANKSAEVNIWTVGNYISNTSKAGFVSKDSGAKETGLRPLIKLNSSVVFNKNADGSYTISY